MKASKKITKTTKVKKPIAAKNKKVAVAKAPIKKIVKAQKKLLPMVKAKVAEKSKKISSAASELILNKAKNLVDQKNTKSKTIKPELTKNAVAAPIIEAEVPRIQSKAFKENLAKLRAISKVNDYSMGSRYNVGDKLMHSKFGLGEVIDCIEYNKISVHFESGDKILIHNDNRNSLTN